MPSPLTARPPVVEFRIRAGLDVKGLGLAFEGLMPRPGMGWCRAAEENLSCRAGCVDRD